MKKIVQFSGMFFLVIMFSTKIFGDNQYEDSMTVKFTDPAKPGLVKVINGKGDITITGYDGKEVIIKTKSEIENVINPPENEKAKGLKRISGTNFHVSTIEDENAVVISRSFQNDIDLFIQVPFKTSLKIGGDNLQKQFEIQKKIMEEQKKVTDAAYVSSVSRIYVPFMSGLLKGDIEVNNVNGYIEINATDGDMTLKEISGEVVANTVDGDILVEFKDINNEKPMFFSSVDGDIDVTFPSDIQADMTMRTVEGDIYTDFEMDIIRTPKVEKSISIQSKERSRPPNIINLDSFYGVGNNISAKVNGGGTEIQMTTIEGSIYIRKIK